MSPMRLALIVFAMLSVSAAQGQAPAGESPKPAAGGSNGPSALSATNLSSLETKIEGLTLNVKDHANRVDRIDQKLQAVEAERAWLDKIKTAAHGLRREANGEPAQAAQPSPPAPVEEENTLPDDLNDVGAKNWRDNQSFQQADSPASERESEAPRRRTLEEINADLQANGLPVTVDGERLRIKDLGSELASKGGDYNQELGQSRRFDSLEQLEEFIKEKTEYLNKKAEAATDEKEHARADLDEATKRRNYEVQRLERIRNDDGQIERELEQADRTRNPLDFLHERDLNELFEAIAEEISSPSRPSTAATTEAPATDRSAVPDGLAGQLIQSIQRLDRDRMTDEAYTERREQLAQENQPGPVIDEEIRRQAELIDQQLAAAEQRYQELIRQNARAEEIRRAWAQQEAIRSQWIQQQYLQQNFSQAVQQAFGGSRFTPPNSSPVITRSGGSSTPTPSRSQSGVGTGRRGGNAAGFRDQFSTVKDPIKAQQYQQTFGGNRKAR